MSYKFQYTLYTESKKMDKVNQVQASSSIALKNHTCWTCTGLHFKQVNLSKYPLFILNKIRFELRAFLTYTNS